MKPSSPKARRGILPHPLILMIFVQIIVIGVILIGISVLHQPNHQDSENTHRFLFFKNLGCVLMLLSVTSILAIITVNAVLRSWNLSPPWLRGPLLPQDTAVSSHPEVQSSLNNCNMDESQQQLEAAVGNHLSDLTIEEVGASTYGFQEQVNGVILHKHAIGSGDAGPPWSSLRRPSQLVISQGMIHRNLLRVPPVKGKGKMILGRLRRRDDSRDIGVQLAH